MRSNLRVLLTGIAGFAGSHLAEYLLRETAVEVHGVIHRHDRRIQHLVSQLHLHRGDLRNALWVSELVQKIQTLQKRLIQKTEDCVEKDYMENNKLSNLDYRIKIQQAIYDAMKK